MLQTPLALPWVIGNQVWLKVAPAHVVVLWQVLQFQAGLGVGVNVGIDNGGLEPPGSEIGVEGKAVFGGVGGVGLNVKFDDCGLSATPAGELGPITFDPSKVGLQPTIDGGPEWLLRNGKISAQAKLYGKVCTQGKW